MRALAFDPSGTLLLSSSNDRTIRGIEVDGDREVFSRHCPKPNSALAFSPDGSDVVSGDELGNLSIWDAVMWSRRKSAKASDAAIWGLAYSPDGRTVAAACGDAKVRIWDPSTGQVILVLDGQTRRVNAVAFAPDGMTLASAGHDGSLRLWNAGPRRVFPGMGPIGSVPAFGRDAGSRAWHHESGRSSIRRARGRNVPASVRSPLTTRVRSRYPPAAHSFRSSNLYS